MRAFGSIIAFFNIYFISATSIEAGMSVSVVLSINSLCTFSTALIFFVAYNEVLRSTHIAGLFIMMASIVFIGISKED